jgi:predicted nuclease with TOPRIM domain
MQSINSLKELNSKLLVEIAELRKKNDKIFVLEKKFAEVEAENVRLKQIIKENARCNAENAKLKSRVGELEARLALLEQTLPFGQTQNGEEAMPVVTITVALTPVPQLYFIQC